jgi:membrane protease YdiL (CAAX protease family)
MLKLQKPQMFTEAEVLRTPKNIFLQILLFTVVFFVANIPATASAFILAIPVIVELASDAGNYDPASAQDRINEYLSSQPMMIVQLFLTVFCLVLAIVYCRFIEKRPVTSMGVRKRKALPNYAIGIVVGFAMFTASYGLVALMGGLEVNSVNFGIHWGIFALFALGFCIQGASEEFTVRGYFMNSIGAKHNAWLAVILSSSMFSFLHILNPGVSLLGLLNIMLFGAFMGLYMIYFDDIWGACATHSVWNFVQGPVYGSSVSGLETGEPIIKTSFTEGKNLINGGEFGLEGGIPVTIVIVLSIVIILLLIQRKQRGAEQ